MSASVVKETRFLAKKPNSNVYKYVVPTIQRQVGSYLKEKPGFEEEGAKYDPERIGDEILNYPTYQFVVKPDVLEKGVVFTDVQSGVYHYYDDRVLLHYLLGGYDPAKIRILKQVAFKLYKLQERLDELSDSAFFKRLLEIMKVNTALSWLASLGERPTVQQLHAYVTVLVVYDILDYPEPAKEMRKIIDGFIVSNEPRFVLPTFRDDFLRSKINVTDVFPGEAEAEEVEPVTEEEETTAVPAEVEPPPPTAVTALVAPPAEVVSPPAATITTAEVATQPTPPVAATTTEAGPLERLATNLTSFAGNVLTTATSMFRVENSNAIEGLSYITPNEILERIKDMYDPQPIHTNLDRIYLLDADLKKRMYDVLINGKDDAEVNRRIYLELMYLFDWPGMAGYLKILLIAASKFFFEKYGKGMNVDALILGAFTQVANMVVLARNAGTSPHRVTDEKGVEHEVTAEVLISFMQIIEMLKVDDSGVDLQSQMPHMWYKNFRHMLALQKHGNATVVNKKHAAFQLLAAFAAYAKTMTSESKPLVDYDGSCWLLKFHSLALYLNLKVPLPSDITFTGFNSNMHEIFIELGMLNVPHIRYRGEFLAGQNTVSLSKSMVRRGDAWKSTRRLFDLKEGGGGDDKDDDGDETDSDGEESVHDYDRGDTFVRLDEPLYAPPDMEDHYYAWKRKMLQADNPHEPSSEERRPLVNFPHNPNAVPIPEPTPWAKELIAQVRSQNKNHPHPPTHAKISIPEPRGAWAKNLIAEARAKAEAADKPVWRQSVNETFSTSSAASSVGP
jgi:hypothetical protein